MFLRKVVGKSMEPTLKPGQLVVFIKKHYKLRTGDIVIFEHDGLEKIKRINVLHPEHIEVAGDNPSHSTDSRQFGLISKDKLKGKLILPVKAAMHRPLKV